MSDKDPELCELCGFPKDSRTHQEGLNGIHDRPVAAPEAEPESETEEGSQTRRRSRG